MANSHLDLTSQGLLGASSRSLRRFSSAPILKGNVTITVPEREAVSRVPARCERPVWPLDDAVWSLDDALTLPRVRRAALPAPAHWESPRHGSAQNTPNPAFHGLVEWFGLEGSFKGHPVQYPCYEQRHLQLDQVPLEPCPIWPWMSPQMGYPPLSTLLKISSLSIIGMYPLLV